MCDAGIYVKKMLEELLAWENWYFAEQKDPRYKTDRAFVDSADECARTRLAGILKKFLSDDAYAEIAAANLSTLGVGRPRIYAQEVVDSVDLGSGRVGIIAVNAETPPMYLKYEMVNVEGVGWRVANIFSSFDQKKWIKKHSV